MSARLIIAAFFVGLATAVTLSAYLTGHMDTHTPHSKPSGTVVYSGVVVSKGCGGSLPGGVTPSPAECGSDASWWITVKDSQGRHATLTVSHAVYDACWIDVFAPARYPDCAKTAAEVTS